VPGSSDGHRPETALEIMGKDLISIAFYLCNRCMGNGMIEATIIGVSNNN